MSEQATASPAEPTRARTGVDVPKDAIQFNPNVAAMKPSATLAMSARAKALSRAGRPVVSLSAGEPDFDTPAAIAEAGIQAIRDGYTRYTDNAGIPELREGIARKLREENGLDYEPSQILCSNGAKQSVALSVFTLCGPGDEVIIPAPYWVSYPEMVKMAGATPIIVPTGVDEGYLMSPEALERAITPRTRMVLLCSPSNPTGAVYGPHEMARLAAVIRPHERVYVLSDEIYEYIIYDVPFQSFAALDGMGDRTITVNGFSKGYAMTGWRLGYLAAEERVVRAAAKVQGQFTSAPCSITQRAGVAALSLDRAEIDRMVAAFRVRRDGLHARINDMDGVRCPLPQGAFYLFPDVSTYLGSRSTTGREIVDTQDLCMYLLEEHDLATVPGQAFGGPGGIRLSYAASDQDLRTAAESLANGLSLLERSSG